MNPSSHHPLLLLLLLLLSLSSPSLAQSPSPSPPSQSSSDDETSNRDRLLFFFFHVIGVICAAVASVTRRSYASTRYIDAIMIILFYIMVLAFLCIALYVTYEYESADMLLIGTAAGMIVFGLHVPRFWSFTARKMHWNGPMWRVKDGDIYKRTRKKKEQGDSARSEWNGYLYQTRLIDQTEAYEIREEDPNHWEQTTVIWQDFVTRGRMGEEQARRAAMALRMAYSVPMPAHVKCGKSEYFAIRGALGIEVMNTWNITSLDYLTKISLFQNRRDRRWEKCEERFSLAYFLHIKLLLHKSRVSEDRDSGTAGAENGTQNWRTRRRTRRENHLEEDWMTLATNWVYGELVKEIQQPDHIEDAFAYGLIKEEDSSAGRWYLLGNQHERVTTSQSSRSNGGAA